MFDGSIDFLCFGRCRPFGPFTFYPYHTLDLSQLIDAILHDLSLLLLEIVRFFTDDSFTHCFECLLVLYVLLPVLFSCLCFQLHQL